MPAVGVNNPRPAPARALVRLNRPVDVLGRPREFIEKKQLVELAVSSDKVGSLGKYLEVADVDGTIIFQIKNKVLSLHNRTSFHDAEGKIMLTLRQKMMTMHGKWEVFRGEGEDDLLFTAERSAAFRKNARMHIFLPSNTTNQKSPDYKIDGSWSDNLFIVSLGGSNTILAEITQKGGKIAVKVAPNVDYAFIATLVVFLGSFDPPVPIRSAFKYTFVGVNFLLAVLSTAGLTL